MKSVVVSVSIIVGLVVGGIVGTVVTYSGLPYTIDRANGFVDLAAATNNLTETLQDLNQTLAILEPFHGNPNPLFATSHTDFDQVKQQIRTTVQAGILVLSVSPSSFAYQQALRNIQSDLTTTVERELRDIGGVIMWWSFGIWLVLAIIAGAALIVIGLIFGEPWEP